MKNSHRQLLINQLKAAIARAEDKERVWEEKTFWKRKDRSAATPAQFNRFLNYIANQSARQALLDLLEDEGDIETSLKISVGYYTSEGRT